MPVDYLPKGCEVVRTAILIVQIAFLNRVGSICLLGDNQFAIFISREPHPARAEERCTSLLEGLLESIKRSEVTNDCLSEFPHRLIVCLWGSKLSEIQFVVQNLPGIIQNASLCRFP